MHQSTFHPLDSNLTASEVQIAQGLKNLLNFTSSSMSNKTLGNHNNT